MSKSEILLELENNYTEMGELVRNQLLTARDAHRFVERYYNVIRAFEDLVKSRDNWRDKYQKLKMEVKKDEGSKTHSN